MIMTEAGRLKEEWTMDGTMIRKKKITFFIAAAAAMCAAAAPCRAKEGGQMMQDYEEKIQGNPYLPLWEYTPDVEPYVFEDPDQPGKYRLYVYGSHDMYKDRYCGDDLVVWSAPVEDLTAWRRDGVIFQSVIYGKADTLYAPDVALVTDENGKKVYYLYPNNQNGGRQSMVAKSDRPDGPFTVCNWKSKAQTRTEGGLGFDPAVFVDDDGQVYGYWGFQDSRWARLNPETMAEPCEGESAHRNIPSYDQMMADNYDPAEYNIVQDENVKKWGFFEASSIRKVGNKYVFIFSRNGLESEPTGKNYNQLAYGYSDSPAGPWKWGGIIVDAQGETIPQPGGGYARTFNGGNTHGSICEIEGQWYVFYHRNLQTFARQAMVEPVTVEWDEQPVTEGGEVRISTAEVTSCGFCTDGLDPFETLSAGRACYLVGGGAITPAYEEDTVTLPIEHLQNGSVVGFKYLNFDRIQPEDDVSLELEIQPKRAGYIDVYMRPVEAANTPVEKGKDGIISVGAGSQLLCTFEIREDPAGADGQSGKEPAEADGQPGEEPAEADGQSSRELTVLRAEVPGVKEYQGKWGVFLVFRGEDGELCDFYNMRFCR